ncbi:MAG: antibiotic biosynthesis monooxygenase [Alphaproteobacteria bacterium]|nr:antibiotic biosynthesis monooxygenase [Alphaproteobacteria bacterium]
MIVRMWRGPVPKEKKAAYVDYLKTTGLKDYASTPGNLATYLLCRDRGAEVEFLTLTLWDSIEAIKAFAGENYATARYYPEDKAFLIRFADEAEHFEVAVGPDEVRAL